MTGWTTKQFRAGAGDRKERCKTADQQENQNFLTLAEDDSVIAN